MGYYKDGKYVRSERYSAKQAFDKAKASQAVNDCLLAVQSGSMTAQQAFRQLLPEFPLLRKEKRRAETEHMLSPLMPYYVAETFGKPMPSPEREVVFKMPNINGKTFKE